MNAITEIAAVEAPKPVFENEYLVDDALRAEAVERIAKAAKQAVRFGCSAPVAVWGDAIRKVYKNSETGRERVTIVHPLKLTLLTTIAFQGWTLLARIEHDPAVGVLVHTVPGCDVPSRFREANPICDHCKAKRIRKDTFVLRHDDGRIVQIGRQCIRDFLGHNPWSLVPFFKSLDDLQRDLDGFGGRWVPPSWSAIEVGRVAIHLIRADGFRPSSFEGPTTKGDTYTVLEPSTGASESAQKEQAWSRKILSEITAEDEQLAFDAIARWLAVDPATARSEFEANCAKIIRADVVTGKHLGLIVAAFNSHLKALGIEAERKRAVKSEFVGTVGKREVFTGVCVRVNSFSTDYGSIHINQLRDETGNVLVWKTGTCKLDQGTTYTLKGTVKEHQTYQGHKRDTGEALPPVKQTVLTRCDIIEERE